ncbi:hypothetical protein RUND412_011298, partial [Rhizina undulata]
MYLAIKNSRGKKRKKRKKRKTQSEYEIPEKPAETPKEATTRKTAAYTARSRKTN